MKASAGVHALILLASVLCPQVHGLQVHGIFPDVSNYIRTGFSSGISRLRFGGKSEDADGALAARDDDADEADGDVDVEEAGRGEDVVAEQEEPEIQDVVQADGDVEVEEAGREDVVAEQEEPETSEDKVLSNEDDDDSADVAVEEMRELPSDNLTQLPSDKQLHHDGADVADELLPTDNLTAWGSIFKPHKYSAKPHLVLGIGFPKCGSHYTWEVLSRAEGTVTGYAKELTYFEKPAGSAETACQPLHLQGQDLNPAQQYIKACYGAEGEVPGRKLLEFSPGYAGLRDGKLDATIQRLKGVERYMHLRMVALVRDPVERATSEINMFREYGTTNGSDEDLSRELHKQMTEFSPVGYHIGAGEYAERLKVWMQNFPKEQLLVVNTAQLGDLTTWKRIFQHVGLGLPSDAWLEEVLYNVHDNGRKKESTYMKLSEDVKQELDGYYAERNEHLWELLGVNPWW